MLVVVAVVVVIVPVKSYLLQPLLMTSWVFFQHIAVAMVVSGLVSTQIDGRQTGDMR